MKTKNTTTTTGYKTGKIYPWLKGVFNFRAGSEKFGEKFDAIELAAETFANVVVQAMPEGHSRKLVLNQIRTIVLTANNEILLEGSPLNLPLGGIVGADASVSV